MALRKNTENIRYICDKRERGQYPSIVCTGEDNEFCRGREGKEKKQAREKEKEIKRETHRESGWKGAVV